MQVPSYVSLGSALSYHGVTTQIQRNWVESVALKRTVWFQAGGTAFHYFKVNRGLYFGFAREGKTFMATREKAFIDACHLSVYGNYALDWNACDLSRLDRNALASLMAPFPQRTLRLIGDLLDPLTGRIDAGSD